VPIQIGKTIESDFTNPIGLLGDCHRRIERFLQTLVKLAENESSELDDQRRKALEISLKYFREAAPRHTADEDDSLFPRLRQSDSADVKAALDRITALHEDHLVAEDLHYKVEKMGQRWLSQNSLAADDLSQFRQLLQQLSTLYQQHIMLEDTNVFPLADRELSMEDKEEMGREMASRRGLDFDKLTGATTSSRTAT